MQFMVLSHRRIEQFEEADFQRVLPDEMDRARQLYADGVIRQIWSRDDRAGSCFVIEAAGLRLPGPWSTSCPWPVWGSRSSP